MSELKIPTGTPAEARICLTCTLKSCKNPLHCERYKEEKKKINGKRSNNTIKISKRAGGRR